MKVENRLPMQAIAHGIDRALYNAAGHPCQFVLVAFPDGRADWITGPTAESEGIEPVRALFRPWLARFIADKPKRQGYPDEAAVAGIMRGLAEVIAESLQDLTGQDRFALVIFPRDVGFYCANITRESGKEVMAELLAELESQP